MSAPYQIDFCQNFNNLWNGYRFGRDYNWDKDRHFQVEKKGNKYVHWTDDPEIWPYDYKPWEAKEY